MNSRDGLNNIIALIILVFLFGNICGCAPPWAHKKGYQSFITIHQYSSDIGVMVNDYLEAMNYSVAHKSSDQEISYTEYFKNLLPLETKGDNNVYVRLYIYKDKMTSNISRVYIKVVNATKGDQKIFHSEINKIGDALFEMISVRIGDQNVKINKSNFAELGP